MDWDLGRYEYIARQLLPAAQAVVECLDPLPGERIVDVGCGTGNAALLSAARGAAVWGIDPSPRLIAVARQTAQAQARGSDVKFQLGSAREIPLPDATVDALVSVFGVIFAPDASAAVAEMARTLGPQGRIVFSAWLPGGAMGELGTLRRDALSAALGETQGGTPFAWHDRATLEAVLAPFGFSVEIEDAELAFTATSPRDYSDGEFRHHPLWVEAQSILGPIGKWEEVSRAAERILADLNEDPQGFRVTSRYVIVTARSGAAA